MHPDGTFTIESEQELNNGTNYFWLAYKVSQDAHLGDVLDAECISFDIGTSIAPDVVAPAGNRLIELVYCNAGSTNISGEHIRRVTIGDIDVTSVKGVNGYEDHTDKIVELALGENIPIAVENASPHSTDALLMWVDWNQDADFDDADELIYNSGPLGITTYMTTITVPLNAKLGLARLRIRLHDTSFGPNATPCGNSNLGEVEDYNIRVVQPTTGMDDVQLMDEVIIYPNPTSDQLVIEANGFDEPVEYSVYNVMGRMLMSDEFLKQVKLNIEAYASDVYFIQFNIAGKKIWKRFVKLE